MRCRFEKFLLDDGSRQLFRAGVEIHLQRKTFDLLVLLVGVRPRALSKRQIRARLWPDVVVGEASLTMEVAALRAALGDDARQPRFVRTVYGFGYAFTAEVEGEAEVSVGAAAARGRPLPRLLWEKRVIPLVEGENTVGRDDGATVRIDAPTISRRHALIHVNDGRVTIEDLGSKNGTFLDESDAPIAGEIALFDQSRVRLGRALLVFRNSPEQGSTPSERHSRSGRG